MTLNAVHCPLCGLAVPPADAVYVYGVGWIHKNCRATEEGDQ